MGLPHRPTQHGEVLSEDVDQPAIYLAPAGDDTVAWIAALGQAEFGRPVGDELVQFVESGGVEQVVQPFAGGQFAPRVLALDALGTAAEAGLGMHAL